MGPYSFKHTSLFDSPSQGSYPKISIDGQSGAFENRHVKVAGIILGQVELLRVYSKREPIATCWVESIPGPEDIPGKEWIPTKIFFVSLFSLTFYFRFSWAFKFPSSDGWSVE